MLFFEMKYIWPTGVSPQKKKKKKERKGGGMAFCLHMEDQHPP
jgi:hypothetical protein